MSDGTDAPTSRDTQAFGAEQPLILVIDDDPDIRGALCELLLSVGLESLAFGSTRDLLAQPLPDRPGCLILDVRLPGPSGLDVHAELIARGEQRPVIFLTAYGDIPMSVQAMKAGAVDFLTKPVRHQVMLDAVWGAIRRDEIQRAADRDLKERLRRLESLSVRELQVFAALSAGKLNKITAFDLGISEITVKMHRRNLMRKLGARSLSALLREWDALPASARDRLTPPVRPKPDRR